MEKNQRLFAVLMAGGRGTRFWPLSREQAPKQLLAIAESRTMIRATVDRVLPLIPPEQVLVITGASHAGKLSSLVPDIPAENIIAEPVGRNTAPCLGLAAAVIRQRCADGLMVVLPADHVIEREDEWRRLIMQGLRLAESRSALVTLGITPTHPETGYGYIEAGVEERLPEGGSAFNAVRFHEKPDLDKAREYLDSGRFFWNSGMFIWRVSTILSWMDRLLPDLSQAMNRLSPVIGRPEFMQTLAEVYRDMQPVSIDQGIMEKADDVFVIPADIGWSDVGSWSAAASHWPKYGDNAAVGQVLALDSANCVVYNPGKHVTLIGVNDLIVVETEDAMLICRKDRDQEVRTAVKILREKGRRDLL